MVKTVGDPGLLQDHQLGCHQSIDMPCSQGLVIEWKDRRQSRP